MKFLEKWNAWRNEIPEPLLTAREVTEGRQKGNFSALHPCWHHYYSGQQFNISIPMANSQWTCWVCITKILSPESSFLQGQCPAIKQQSNNNQITIKQQPNPAGSLLQFCKFTSAPKPSRRTCWSSTFIAFIPNFSPLWLGTAQIGRCRWERLRAAGVAQTHWPQFSLWNAEIFQSCGRIWKALLFYGPSCNGTEMSFPLLTPNAGMAFCSWADNFPGWNKKKNSDISTPIFALYFLM